jgi:hypothetical protein
MSTVATLHPEKQNFTQDSEPVLFLLISLCLINDQTNKMLDEDPNGFSNAFLDGDEEQTDSISIR